MAIQHPKIDHRDFDEIVRQILGGDDPTVRDGLRKIYAPEWMGKATDDPGIVLTMLFGKLMEIVLERLNGVPEKHFIAFLDVLGIDRRPGNVSRTPVKFILPKGNTTGGLVGANTQVATGPTESGQVHVFETEKSFDVTATPIEKVISILPQADLYADLTFIAGQTTEEDIPVAHGDVQFEHSLYLAHDTLFAFNRAGTLSIDINPTPSGDAFDFSALGLEVIWERFVMDDEGKINPVVITPDNEEAPFVFTDFAGTVKSEQGKKENCGGAAHWIRARLKTPLLAEASLPEIREISFDLALNSGTIPFDAALHNSVPVDINKDFFPYGEEPQLGDAFYLASNEVFSLPGAALTFQIEKSPAYPEAGDNKTSDLLLKWEGWNGTQWVGLNDDTTNHFTSDGSVVFHLPAAPNHLKPIALNGIESHWIRVRIAVGDYGQPSRYVPIPMTDPIEYELQPAKPPVLSALRLSYIKEYSSESIEKCITRNAFAFENHINPETSMLEPFFPFVRIAETEPALYLGFKKPFGDKQISMFFHLIELPDRTGSGDVAASDDVTPGRAFAQVVWEYANDRGGWIRLEVQDDTDHFMTSGTVSFLGPGDLGKREEFGEALFWLRARFQTDSDLSPPERLLKGVHLNTVWAANQVTVRDEILGSGTARASQSVVFSQRPVLSGEKIYVREPELPSQEERLELEALEATQLRRRLTTMEKQDLVRIIPNSLTGEDEIWVRWHRVDKFFASGPQSRHYILDAVNGIVTCGDGRKGAVFPLGRDNIKAFFYRAGGGAAASKEAAAEDVKELRSSLPFVDKAAGILDPEGGSNAESVDDVLESGPQIIKNRDRAVTIEDYVWLARQASTLVHQAKCLPTTRPAVNNALEFAAGAVTLLLVPDSEASRPRPTQALQRVVKNYILDRCLTVIKPDIYTIPPLYEEVSVRAQVKAGNPEESSVVEGRILNRLQLFLHPVKGGPKETGWEFGRNVFVSEIYQLVEETEGVDAVVRAELSSESNPAPKEQVEIGDNQLPVSGEHEIEMV